jgi:hypothetical protein
MSELDATQSAIAPARKLAGIGGWLILPMIGMFITPLVGLWDLQNVTSTFAVAQELADLRGALVVGEIVGNFLLQIVMPIVLLILFFRSSARFPRLYVTWMLVNVVYVVVDLILAYFAFRLVWESGAAEFWDAENVRNIARSFVVAAIWVPYMRKSVRVKNTFVN